MFTFTDQGRKGLLSGYNPPFGYDLAVGGFFEYDFDRRAYGNVVNWGSGEVGVHLDSGVVVERDDGEVEGLVFVKGGDWRIVHDAVVVDFSTTAHCFPFEAVS